MLINRRTGSLTNLGVKPHPQLIVAMFFGPIDFISKCFFKILLLIDAIVYHTYVCYDNGKKLFTLLIRGTRTWVIMLFRLVLFTLLLAPGWYKLLRYWFLSPLIIRNLRYGKGAKNRNLLDVYLPVPQKRSKNKDVSGDAINYNHSYSQKNGAPVVVFVSGGAWTIGYKLWSALVARGLAKLGILTIVPDYRNFPQGDVEDMMEDIRLAVEWTSINAHRFGGDASKIVLSGQSAGAHITLCLLVSDYLHKKMLEEDAKRKTSRRFSRAQAERFLSSADGSGPIYEDDNDSESEVGSDFSEEDEELLEREELATPLTATRSDDAVTEGDDAGVVRVTHPSKTPVAEADISPLTVEYTTPLRSNANISKLPKSPRANLQLHTTSTDGEVKSPSGRRVRRTTSSSSHKASICGAGVGFEDDEQLNTNDNINRTLSPSHKKHHSTSHNETKARPSSGSIIDLIDTYLGANISSNNHSHHSTSGKIISSTASSLKKKFREQVRRNSEATHYDLDHFSQEGNSSSEPEDTGPWREVESVRKSAQKHHLHTPLHHSSNINTPIVGGAMLSALSPTPFVPRPTGMADSHKVNPLTEAVVQDPEIAMLNPMMPWGRASSRVARARAKRLKKKFCVASNIKLFIGVSGPYNLEALESHLHQRGMDARILNWICRGSIGNYSPTTQLAEHARHLLALQHQELVDANPDSVPISPQVFSVRQPSAALADLTPIALFHGSRDATIPVSSCLDLSEVLQTHGANALCKIYEGWSHTDAILEAPLSGTMRLFNDMAGVIFAHTAECSSTGSSVNNIDGLPQQPTPLTVPLHLDAQDPADNNNYVCSPLDYVSLFLFPKLFGSGTATPSTASTATAGAPAVIVEPVHVPGDANTNANTSSEETSGRVNEKMRRKQHLERKNKRNGHEKKSSGNDAMVSQLLVKIAREINPF